MKLVISILLTSAIILQSFSSLVIVAGYELNKDYITKTFCENKNKPTMHCNGKCHMMKQIKKQEKKEQNPVGPSKDKQESIQFFQSQVTLSFNSFSVTKQQFPIYLFAKPQEITFSFLHPPQA